MDRFTKHRWKHRLQTAKEAAPFVTLLVLGGVNIGRGITQHILFGLDPTTLLHYATGFVLIAAAVFYEFPVRSTQG